MNKIKTIQANLNLKTICKNVKEERGGKMEQNILDFFEQKTTACNLERKRLQEEERGDEANFEKIRANVYDIFKTVFLTAEKQYGGDRLKMWEFFLKKLEQIPSGWTAAYEEARRHDDARAMHIESVKLETARDIRENILQIKERENDRK